MNSMWRAHVDVMHILGVLDWKKVTFTLIVHKLEALTSMPAVINYCFTKTT